MATATAQHAQIIAGVTLNLSLEEATFLRHLMRCIGGDPVTSPRRHADAIDGALIEAGIKWSIRMSDVAYSNAGSPNIYFQDNA